jgi:hypothetical protein
MLVKWAVYVEDIGVHLCNVKTKGKGFALVQYLCNRVALVTDLTTLSCCTSSTEEGARRWEIRSCDNPSTQT